MHIGFGSQSSLLREEVAKLQKQREEEQKIASLEADWDKTRGEGEGMGWPAKGDGGRMGS